MAGRRAGDDRRRTESRMSTMYARGSAATRDHHGGTERRARRQWSLRC
jgi:hypothetical protein